MIAESLILRFSSSPFPELVETTFRHPLIPNPVTASRGKDSAFTDASFQWTPAVRGLSVLALRTRAEGGGPFPAELAGGAGSLAAALDYAVSRGAQWIVEMFGRTANGAVLARRCFVRTNPERKRPGPVQVSFNPRLLSPAAIRIVLDGRELSSETELRALAMRIESRSEQRRYRPKLATEPSREPPSFTIETLKIPGNIRELLSDAAHPSSGPFRFRKFREHMHEQIRWELASSLQKTAVFSPSAYRRRMNDVRSNPSFRDLATPNVALASELDLQLAGLRDTPRDEFRMRLALCRTAPIRFAVTPSQTAIIAMVMYLRYIKGYNIDLDYRFSHTSEIAQHMHELSFPEHAGACALSIASWAVLSGVRPLEYRPFMLLPTATHRIVQHRRGNRGPVRLTPGEYHFVSEIPSTPGFLFDTLIRQNALEPGSVSAVHAGPEETLLALASRDSSVRAITWFPHGELNIALNDCESVPVPVPSAVYPENVLLLHETIARDQELSTCLLLAIRDAWRVLAQQGESYRLIACVLAENPDYTSWLSRYAGLDALPESALSAFAA